MSTTITQSTPVQQSYGLHGIPNTPSATLYAVIRRHPDGRELIDTTTLAPTPEQAKATADFHNNSSELYANAPAFAIAQLHIQTIAILPPQ